MLLDVALREGCGGRRRGGELRRGLLCASPLKRERRGRERLGCPDPQSPGVIGCELPRRGQVSESRGNMNDVTT